MKLYIEYQNGNILNHPIFEDNLKQVIPDFYITDLVSKPYNPEVRNFIEFTRTAPPDITPYQHYPVTNYVYDSNIFGVRDNWTVVDFTPEEKAAKIETFQQHWLTLNIQGWTFDEANLKYDPPTPYPADGNVYRWDNITLTWAPFTE